MTDSTPHRFRDLTSGFAFNADGSIMMTLIASHRARPQRWILTTDFGTEKSSPKCWQKSWHCRCYIFVYTYIAPLVVCGALRISTRGRSASVKMTHRPPSSRVVDAIISASMLAA